MNAAINQAENEGNHDQFLCAALGTGHRLISDTAMHHSHKAEECTTKESIIRLLLVHPALLSCPTACHTLHIQP